jgi:hypothetical protein
MSSDDQEYRETENIKSPKKVRKLKTATFKPLLKSGKSLGIKRSMVEYPKSAVPVKKQILRPIENLSLEKIMAIPFKVPKFIKPIKPMGGGLRPGTTLGVKRTTVQKIHALHDPNADEAFVIYRPKICLSETERQARVASNPGKPPNFEVEVVVVNRDFILGSCSFRDFATASKGGSPVPLRLCDWT